MKSPFPGMDPYLEAHWPGLHTHLVTFATGALNRTLPSGLIAQAEERLAIEANEELIRSVSPDVKVYETKGGEREDGGIAISAPYKLVIESEPSTERFIRIIQADSGKLITSIEFISPTNKMGQGLEQYLRKRDELLDAGVHVVEIDLVRRGNWRAMMRPHVCPLEAVEPYRVTIRVGGWHGAYLYPVALRRPLPSIPIPLRPGDKEVKLDLQGLLDQACELARYDQWINYTLLPDPPLEEDDAAWAEGLMKRQPEKA